MKIIGTQQEISALKEECSNYNDCDDCILVQFCESNLFTKVTQGQMKALESNIKNATAKPILIKSILITKGENNEH